ncbi:STAS domain-containing protein [Streptomyces sp. NPDC006640]|uniref:STAS domain-containing protein n=1 Tax=unclassified Streptomyces TaxID=2593676 RepID=UPI00368A45C6
MADLHGPAEQSARLSITETAAAGIRVLVLSGETDADNVNTLGRALQVKDGGLPHVVPDFRGVTFMDSSGVDALAAAYRASEAADGWVRLAALTAPIQRVVELVGLDSVISCYPTLPQALTA